MPLETIIVSDYEQPAKVAQIKAFPPKPLSSGEISVYAPHFTIDELIGVLSSLLNQLIACRHVTWRDRPFEEHP